MIDEIKDETVSQENKEKFPQEVVEVLTKIREGELRYLAEFSDHLQTTGAMIKDAPGEEVEKIYNERLAQELKGGESGLGESVARVLGGISVAENPVGTSYELPYNYNYFGQAFGRIAKNVSDSLKEDSIVPSGHDNYDDKLSFETWTGETSTGKPLSLNVEHVETKYGEHLRYVKSFSVGKPSN